MKIISWNVNGLRAIHRKGNFKWLLRESPDVFCFQETKAHPDQLLDELKRCEGYHSYFAFPDEKKGYSGVAIYTKKEPDKMINGMRRSEFDKEGRMIEAHYGNLILANVYFPNGGGGPLRLKYKLDFYDAFLEHIDGLKSGGKQVIFCGDINTAHEEIDLARPKQNEEHTGFLPEERAWMDEVVNHGWIDVFRHFYPDKRDVYTYWDIKTGARERNVGWRIDYFFVSPNLQNKIKKTSIMTDILGSDHCPILLEMEV